MDQEIFEHGIQGARQQEQTRLEFLLSGRTEDGKYLRASPLAPRCVEFDFAEVSRRLGEDEDQGLVEYDFELVAQQLGQLLRWVVRISKKDPRGELPAIGRRAVALAWLLNPGFFDGVSKKGIRRVVDSIKERHRIGIPQFQPADNSKN